MLKPLIILALSLTFVGCTTTSTENNSATSNTQEKKVAKNEEAEEQKYICRRTKTIGSHFAKRQCWTVAEYEERKKRDRESMEYIKNQQTGAPLPVENK